MPPLLVEMAAGEATTGAQAEKKRVSKAVKRKAKKAPGAEAPADDEEKSEEEAEAAPAKESGPNKKPRKTKANRLEEMQAAADKEPVEARGVIYVGHIPDGFFEPQMRKFFSQFGKVTRLRISRSKKTAKSKGYAFVEFEEESVAKIVAETMQGYLLFDKTLVCHQLPREKCHPMLFKGCKRRMMNQTNARRKRHTQKYNDRPKVDVDGEQVPRVTTRQAARRTQSDKKLAKTLADLGVDYDFGAADEPARGPKAAPKSTEAPPAKSTTATAPTPAGASAKKKKKQRVGA